MIHPDLPLKAISIMQPWAWLIVNGHKDIENRDWQTRFRGPVAIHAGKKQDDDCMFMLHDGLHPVTGEDNSYFSPPENHIYERGGIVGVAEIIGCVEGSANPWFVGRYGFVIRNAHPISFIPCKGALSFFDWRKNVTS